MPARVTYWTGIWDPAKEAISKEVNALRTGHRARAPVVSFSPGQSSAVHAADRVLQLSGDSWPILRAVAALVERRGDVTHIFGGQISWHLFRALGRRPILLTAIASRGGTERLPHVNIARVAIESDTGADEWIEAGVPRERIVVVRPGVDLRWFGEVPAPPDGRFTLLFASTPSDPAEIGPRGIALLVELAKRRRDIDVLVPWRQWGSIAAAQSVLDGLTPPPNFIIMHGDMPDMRVQYARAHATVVCFDRHIGKTCPSFVLEGLAAGRPCLASSGIGIAATLARTGAGVVTDREADALAAGVDQMRADWRAFATRARRLAEDEFDLNRFRAAYDRLYDDIASEAAASRRAAR